MSALEKRIVLLDRILAARHVMHFRAAELLYRGGNHGNGTAHNDLCPESLLENLAEVARLADDLREDFGSPLRVLSAYRSETYNRAVGGARSSLHLQARALDLAPVNPGRIPEFRALARARFDAGIHRGGTGIYQTFVHLDTGRPRIW